MPKGTKNKKGFVQSVPKGAVMKKSFICIVIALAILLFLIFNTKTASQSLPAPESVTAQTIQTITQPAEKKTEALQAAEYDTLTQSIVQVLAQKETSNADDCITHRGQSGERGCFQFLPSTWAGYSKQVFGYVAEQTPENELAVTLAKVSGWLKQGLTPQQIFLQWQQGNYDQCKRGVNSHGVKYDSCAYVQDAMQKLNSLIHPKG